MLVQRTFCYRQYLTVNCLTAANYIDSNYTQSVTGVNVNGEGEIYDFWRLFSQIIW